MTSSSSEKSSNSESIPPKTPGLLRRRPRRVYEVTVTCTSVSAALQRRAGLAEGRSRGRGRRVDNMNRFLLVAMAVLVLAAPAGASSLDFAAYGSDPPPEPKPCTPSRATAGLMIKGTDRPDTLCGTRGDDRLIAGGGRA